MDYNAAVCMVCHRTVGSLTACSRREDRFTVAQLNGCNAAVVSTLLSCLLAIEAHIGKKANQQSPHLLSHTNIQWATVNNCMNLAQFHLIWPLIYVNLTHLTTSHQHPSCVL